MPRHFFRVSDDLLLIEIIRRLRHASIPNVDYIAYPGVKFDKVLSAARLFFTEDRLRELLQQLVDDGALCCTGYVFHYFSPITHGEKGILTWWHPEHILASAHWFTELNTPAPLLNSKKVKDREIPATRVQYQFLYVTGDGLPKRVQADISKSRIVFSRETLYPWLHTS